MFPKCYEFLNNLIIEEIIIYKKYFLLYLHIFRQKSTFFKISFYLFLMSKAYLHITEQRND